MKYRFILFFLLIFNVLFAQTNVGLVAYYPFNSGVADATGNTANAGIPEGNPTYGCGVLGGALQLNGANDQIAFLGPITQEFDTEDFTLSFYFKAIGLGGSQYLVSKRRSDCGTDNSFYIRYVPSSRTLNVLFSENAGKSVSFVEKLDPNTCWNHVTIIRQSTRVRLYINGQLRQELLSNSRINILNDGPLFIGGSDCLSANESRFSGLIDEFRVYFRALDELETRGLYNAPDMIVNRDTLLYLGGSVQINLSSTCATGFSWSPTTGVDFPNNSNPIITPDKPGIQFYTLRLSDNVASCIATDTIRINVVDPDNLDCGTVFLPKAFTPNGDGLNDTYGISNPFALRELISFEIFDRWGGRVFFTTDPFTHWNGAFKDTDTNSGVFLYRVRYICEGEEKVAAGSVTVMR
ncbi:MAG: LamG-like jellyroll fold domain-containing protein [Saprospiraceae bacterium]|nr:LamG-like jellyroll fold domain-containing protein [Saprospiraceae bacterium]